MRYELCLILLLLVLLAIILNLNFKLSLFVMSEIELIQVKEIAYNIIVIMHWHLKQEEKRRIKESREIRERKSCWICDGDY